MGKGVSLRTTEKETVCYFEDSIPKCTTNGVGGVRSWKLFSSVRWILCFFIFMLFAGFVQGSEFSGTEVIFQCLYAQDVFVDSTTGTVYAACSGGGSGSGVIKINDMTSVRIDSNSVCTNAGSVSVDTTINTVYAACGSGGVVKINDTASVRIDNNTCPYASSVSVNSITGTVYAACQGNGVVKINDTASVRIDNNTCLSAWDVSVDSTTGTVYAACDQNGVIKINKTASVRIDNKTCPYAVSVSIDSTTGTLYAICGITYNVFKINKTASVRIDNNMCSSAKSVSVNSATGIVYAACGSGVIGINGEIVTIMATISQCSNVESVFVNSATGIVYAACGGSGVIKINGGASVSIADTCLDAKSVSVDSTTGTLYAACYDGVVKINGGASFRINNKMCLRVTGVSVGSTRGTLYTACYGGVIKITGTASIPIDNGMCSTAASVFFDRTTDIVYAACYGGGIIKINGGTSVRIDNKMCLDARSVSVDSITGTVYASCNDGGMIKINEGTSVRINNSMCSYAMSVSVDSTTGTVYAGCIRGVIKINETVSVRIDNGMCSSAASVFFDRTTGTVYAACGSGGVIKIDGGTSVRIDSGSACSQAQGVFIESTTGTVYAACYNGVVAFTSRFNCPPGYYWTATGCSPCPLGSFHGNTISNLKGCTPCPLGSIAPTVGSVSCTTCAPGTRFVNAAIPCLNCAPGFYSNTSGSISCSPCLAGYYGGSEGLTDPTCSGQCAPGYWCREASSSNTSLPCDSPGTYCPVGSEIPTLVPQGSYATNCLTAATTNTPSSRCSFYADCTPGTYCVNGIQRICTNGTVSGPKQSKCDVCSEGKYHPTDGRSICLLCPPGTSQPSPGSSSCNKCSTSLFASGEGNIRCSRCPEGDAINSNQTGCISSASCPDGHEFDEVEGTCIMCKVGTFSTKGVKCQPSPPNTYAPLPGCSVPLVCPSASGISCANGFAYAQEGYWVYTSNSQTGEVKVLPCLPNACVGGTVYSSQCDANRLQTTSNIMCGECAEGYSLWGGKCYLCEKSNDSLIIVVVICSMFFVGGMHYLSQSVGSANLSIFFYFVQVGIIICGSNTGAFVNWLSIFNFQPQNFVGSCLLPLNSYQSMAADVAIPFLYFGELAIIMIFHLGFNYCVGPVTLNRPPVCTVSYPIYLFKNALIGFDKNRYIRTFTTLYLTSFSMFLTLVLRYMYCIDVGSESVLYFNPSISCSDPKYKRWLIPVILLLVFILCLVPIVTVLYLWCYKTRLNTDTEEDKVFAYRWGILHEPFSSNAFYYQGIILLRRLLVGVFATVLVTQPVNEYLSFTLLHAVLCIAHTHIKPYKEKKSNIMEELSLLLLTLLSSVLLAYPPPSFSKGILAAVAILYVIPSILGMVDAMLPHSKTLLGSVTRMRNNRKVLEETQSMDPHNEIELDVLANSAEISHSPSVVLHPPSTIPFTGVTQETVVKGNKLTPRLFPLSDSRGSLDIEDVKTDREVVQREGPRRRNRSVEDRSQR